MAISLASFVRKRRSKTEFAYAIKNVTPNAIKISVPLGYVERLPVTTDDEYDALVDKNRANYRTTLEEI